MNRADIEKRAEFYAMSHYLSEWDTSNFDEIREAFYKDKIPDDVIIWDRFEDEPLERLADYLELSRNDFIQFYEDVSQ